jgi:predicted patatin/cPLA2 family phospholipase
VNDVEKPLESNIFDTALIFEGGGMRASYTAGTVVTLLENGLYFNNVYGVSAGSSHTVNYLSRDIPRTKKSFVDLVQDHHYAGLGHFFLHEGWFNSYYCYQKVAKPDGALPYDIDTFCANPAHACIEGFQADTGKTVYWTEKDMRTTEDLMARVRASSSMPFFMPETIIDGVSYYDGGLGEDAGLMLPKAKQDGFKRFFVVLTRPKGYRKTPPDHQRLMKFYYFRRPAVYEALVNRWHIYNDILDELEQLERDGKAFLVYPENMKVYNMEGDFKLLQQSYEDGYAQAQRELESWKEFLL